MKQANKTQYRNRRRDLCNANPNESQKQKQKNSIKIIINTLHYSQHAAWKYKTDNILRLRQKNSATSAT